MIFVPVLNELYFASKELGSFKGSGITAGSEFEGIEKVAGKLPLDMEKKAYTVVASKSHLSPETEVYKDSLEKQNDKVLTLSKGSSLKLCMVAEGQADCYPRFAPTMERDTAAGQAICTYAGKKVLDYTTNKEMLYNRENLLNNWFLVK